MRQWLPLYEGDGYVHYRGPENRPAAGPSASTCAGQSPAGPAGPSPAGPSSDGSSPAGSSPDASSPGGSFPTEPSGAEPSQANEVRRLRAETLRAWFPKAAAWARDRIRYARMCEAERYLAEATDLADLERRMQEADRRGLNFNQ